MTSSHTSRRIAIVAPLWHAIPPADYGGTELIVHLLVEGLVARGHDVTLYASGDSRTRARLCAVVDRPLASAMAERLVYEYEPYVNTAVIQALRAEPPFDVVHCHTGYVHVPLAVLARSPVLCTMHTVPTSDHCWVLSQFPHAPVSAISTHQARAIGKNRSFGTPVILHGIDFDEYDPATRPGDYVLFLGRMSRQKSPLHAIRIARSAGVPLILAGRPEDSNEVAYFDSEVKPLIDGHHVRYVGPVDFATKKELLANAIALLFPIQGEEAFGLAMIESMACGTPVVGWERASVPEVVDFGITGFFADSVDVLANLVHRAATLDRARVRDHARMRFDRRRMVRDYELLYERVIAGVAPGSHAPSSRVV